MTDPCPDHERRITRLETILETDHEHLKKQVRELEEARFEAEGKHQLTVWIIGVLAAAAGSIVGHIWK